MSLYTHLKSASKRLYGAAIRSFLAGITTEKREDLAEMVNAMVRDFVSVLPEDADGQVKRVAARFGLPAAASELADHLGSSPVSARLPLRASILVLSIG